MTKTEYAAVVRNALKQYDEGAIMASELYNHLLSKAVEVGLSCPNFNCQKEFGDVAPVVCDACGANTLPPIEGDLS